VIQVWLWGGASQLETYDPKPDAPAEYRGPYGTIPTSVPGLEISELLPRHARVMDRVAVLRSVHHKENDHQAGMHLCLTGHSPQKDPFVESSHPSVGSVVARTRGSNQRGLPPYVRIGWNPDEKPWRDLPYRAATWGARYDPMELLTVAEEDSYRTSSLDLVAGLTTGRLEGRRALLKRFDSLRRRLDATGTMSTMDHFHRLATDMLTTEKARQAFDLEKEDPRLRDRYGRHRSGQTYLLARRLVEAGVTFVTVIDPGFGQVPNSYGWDMHHKLERGMEHCAPPFDQALTALIEDVHDRGLDRDVLVLVWGEFGRTPRINKFAGRDHWANLQSVLISGGGLRMGQVIGSSTDKGEVPRDRPLWAHDVLAMLYRHLGIDPRRTFPNDAGRPVFVLPKGEVIEELV
jgi:hypothetical protein